MSFVCEVGSDGFGDSDGAVFGERNVGVEAVDLPEFVVGESACAEEQADDTSVKKLFKKHRFKLVVVDFVAESEGPAGPEELEEREGLEELVESVESAC